MHQYQSLVVRGHKSHQRHKSHSWSPEDEHFPFWTLHGLFFSATLRSKYQLCTRDTSHSNKTINRHIAELKFDLKILLYSSTGRISTSTSIFPRCHFHFPVLSNHTRHHIWAISFVLIPRSAFQAEWSTAQPSPTMIYKLTLKFISHLLSLAYGDFHIHEEWN